MPEKRSLYQSLVEVGAACGEAAGILDVSYLRKAHQRRQHLIEAVGSAAVDGRMTTPERLYAWLSDIPIQAQANLGAEAYASELFRVMADPEDPTPLAHEAQDLAASTYARVQRDPLAGAAVLFRGRDAITPASRAAYVLFLCQALGPAAPAPSPLLLGLEAAARRPAALFDAYVAERLCKASRRALANARTLRAAVATVYAVLGSARRSSRVHAIAELLFAGHPLSIASASRIFRISRLAAREHLTRLERDGLVEAATRRKSGIIYIARDGLLTFGQPGLAPAAKPTSRLAVTTGKPLTAEQRARLDKVTDEVGDRIRNLDRMLARLQVLERR